MNESKQLLALAILGLGPMGSACGGCSGSTMATARHEQTQETSMLVTRSKPASAQREPTGDRAAPPSKHELVGKVQEQPQGDGQSAADNVASAKRFWTQFRSAVLAEDRATVADLVRFPITVRGGLDFMPVRTYDRSGFLRVYDKLFDQLIPVFVEQNSYDTVDLSMRELVRRTEHPPSPNQYDPEYTRFRVENFEFERTHEGQWQLTQAYLDEQW